MFKTSTRLSCHVFPNIRKNILCKVIGYECQNWSLKTNVKVLGATTRTHQVTFHTNASNGNLTKVCSLNGQNHVYYGRIETQHANASQWLNSAQRIRPDLSGVARPSQPHRSYASAAKGDLKNLYDFREQERVYYGSLTPRMRAVKIFSLTTSLAGLAAQPILMEQGMKMGGTGMAVLLCSFAGFFTFVTPFLLHFITKKYVTEIHFNPKTGEYTATTISIILQKLHTKFKPSDVKVPEVPGMFTSFVVNNKPLFVDPALFENPEHYVRIMGYDKPVDFKLDLNPDKSKKNVR